MALPQVTIFWDKNKKDDEGKPMPPVTQDAVNFGPAGSWFVIQDPNQMVYYFPSDKIDAVAVALPDPEAAPEAPEDSSGDETTDATPLIHLPRPSED